MAINYCSSNKLLSSNHPHNDPVIRVDVPQLGVVDFKNVGETKLST